MKATKTKFLLGKKLIVNKCHFFDIILLVMAKLLTDLIKSRKICDRIRRIVFIFEQN
jgi:hypothetical protein